jgi:cytochrome c553
MRCKLMIPLSLTALAFAAPALRAQDATAERLAAQVCASCHGPRGDSISPAFPRLAGQRQEYLENQLKAFHDKKRGDPMAQAYMWGMSSQLDDDTIKKLAAFYSAQKPVRGKPGDAKLMQSGKAIYEQGVPAAKVAACASCHGPNAEGNAAFPRLAGQHAEYLVKQMVLFQSSLREGSGAATMHTVTTGMSLEQMTSVAAYAASK